jgi:hypothetical protein
LPEPQTKQSTSFPTTSFLSTIYLYTIIFSPENSSSGVERMKKDKVRLLYYKYFPEIKKKSYKNKQ